MGVLLSWFLIGLQGMFLFLFGDERAPRWDASERRPESEQWSVHAFISRHPSNINVKTHLNKLGLCMLYLWSLWTDVTDTDLWWEWNSYFKGSGHPKVIIQSLCRWSVVTHRKMFWIYTVTRRWTILLNNWTRRGIVLKHKIAPHLLCSAKSPEAPRS